GDFRYLQAVADTPVYPSDDLLVCFVKTIGPPVDREERSVIILYRFHEQIVVPSSPFDRSSIVLMFQDHRKSGPEELCHFAVKPTVWRWLYQNAVVMYGHSL